MAAITICSDFGAPQNKVSHCFHCFPMKSAIVEVFTPQCYESEPFFFKYIEPVVEHLSACHCLHPDAAFCSFTFGRVEKTPYLSSEAPPPPATFDNPLVSSSGVFSLSFHTNSPSIFKAAPNLCYSTL